MASLGAVLGANQVLKLWAWCIFHFNLMPFVLWVSLGESVPHTSPTEWPHSHTMKVISQARQVGSHQTLSAEQGGVTKESPLWTDICGVQATPSTSWFFLRRVKVLFFPSFSEPCWPTTLLGLHSDLTYAYSANDQMMGKHPFPQRVRKICFPCDGNV